MRRNLILFPNAAIEASEARLSRPHFRDELTLPRYIRRSPSPGCPGLLESWPERNGTLGRAGLFLLQARHSGSPAAAFPAASARSRDKCIGRTGCHRSELIA